MEQREYIKVIYKPFNLEYNIRRMTPDEIDNSEDYFCSDETGHIFKKEELIFPS